MEEGLTAPVGSTKRKRAQKMLSILKRTTVDGQGGPGPRSIPRVNIQLKPSSIDYSNLLILPPTPPIRVQFGEKAPTPRPSVHDGQGYPGPMDGQGFLGFGGSAAPYVQSMATRLTGGLAAARTGASMFGGPVGAGIAAASFGIPAIGKNFMYGMQDRLVNNPGNPAYRTSNSTVPYQEVLPYGQTATGNKVAAASPIPAYWGINSATGTPMGRTTQSNPTQRNPTQSNQPQYNQPLGPVQSGSQTPTEISTPGMSNFTETTEGPASKFPGVQSAVDSNMGPTMFAYNALQKGGDTLKEFVPNASGLMLEGGGMYDRLMKIEEATRKSYGLDQMRDQLNSLVMSGSTLEGSLTDYVRGRDEFLNETEDVISDLKHRSMKMDMSDPRTRGNMQQHFNYLYELRGRQNKRYVEFLDMSVNAYQGKVDAAKSVYETEFGQYENEVLNKQNIAKEEYSTLFTGLQEMYNTVAGAETAELEKQMMQYQVAAARAASIKDVISLEGVNSGDVMELDKTLKAMNVIDTNGAWVPTNNALNLSGVNIYQLPDRMDQAVARAMFKYDEKGNAIGPADKDQALYIAQNALGVLMQLQAANVLVGDEYARREESIRNTLARNLEQSQTFVPTDLLPSYRKAVESLAGDGWIFNRKTPSREDFIRKWGPEGEKLDSGMLNTIYSNLEGYIQDGQTGRSFVDTFFQDLGELAQPGEQIDSDSLMRRKMLQDYLQRLQPQKISGTLNFSKVGGDTNTASIQKAGQAIANIESGGGNYSAVGPQTSNGDKAYGKHQVMGANIPSWTKAAIGVALTPQQFLANPQAQEAVFAHVFGGYVKQYGSFDDAASVWFTGRPIAQNNNARDILGTTANSYVSRFQQYFYS